MNAGYCCFWVVESGNNFRFISSWASLLGEFIDVFSFFLEEYFQLSSLIHIQAVNG